MGGNCARAGIPKRESLQNTLEVGHWPPQWVNTKTQTHDAVYLLNHCAILTLRKLKTTQRKQLIQDAHLRVEERRSEIATPSEPRRLLPSSPPLGSQDPKVDQATEISAWQEPALQAWPTSSNLSPPALSVDHGFQEPSYKYPLSEMPCSSGTLSPNPRAPCTLLKQCQFATSQPSESALHTQPQWAAQTSLLERLAGPQDCYCKLMAWQLVVKNTN